MSVRRNDGDCRNLFDTGGNYQLNDLKRLVLPPRDSLVRLFEFAGVRQPQSELPFHRGVRRQNPTECSIGDLDIGDKNCLCPAAFEPGEINFPSAISSRRYLLEAAKHNT